MTQSNKQNELCKKVIAEIVSNGHSPANLSNSSTRQKFAIFFVTRHANLASIEQIFVTRSGEFGEY
jgi:hypothetical protein